MMALMKPKLSILLLGLLIGYAQAVFFPLLNDAVKGLPELSLLAVQFDTVAPALAAQLRAPGFMGTLFAPTNATLGPLQKYQSLMPASMMQDIFSMAVIPGPPLKLTDLVNGAVLTTLNNKTVTVKVTQAADGSGPIYYINQARVMAGNVYAGTSILHETFGLIVPPANQNLINAVAPKDVASPSATTNMSPEGPPQPSPSPSPATVPSPSPATVPSPSPAVVTPSPSPATHSPFPAPAKSPSPAPAVPSPSPAPATASPSPVPANGGVTPSPSPSPAPAKSPSPASPAPPKLPSPAPHPASPSPAPAGDSKGEVIEIPQPLPSPSPSPSVPGSVVTEKGTINTTDSGTLNSTTVPGGVYSAGGATVVGMLALAVPVVAGMLLL